MPFATLRMQRRDMQLDFFAFGEGKKFKIGEPKLDAGFQFRADDEATARALLSKEGVWAALPPFAKNHGMNIFDKDHMSRQPKLRNSTAVLSTVFPISEDLGECLQKVCRLADELEHSV